METHIPLSLERRLYEARKIVPPENFRESLKAFLFSHIGEKNEMWFSQQMQTIEAISILGTKERIWSGISKNLGTPIRQDGVRMLLTFLRHPYVWKISSLLLAVLFGIFLFGRFLMGKEYTEIPTTLLTHVNGDVAFFQDNKPISLEEESKLLSDVRITTGAESDAEIVFFDDSLLLLGADSSIVIKKNIPHPSFPHIGDIEIVLEQGNIWLRNFTDPDNDHSIVVESGSIVIAPHSAALDISRQSSEVSIRIWNHSARIADRDAQQSSIFIADSKVSFSLVEGRGVEPISGAEKNEPWIQQSFANDETYRRQRLDRIIHSYEKETGVLPDSVWYFLKQLLEKGISGAPSGSGRLELIEKRFQEAILLAFEENYSLAEKTLIKAVQDLKTVLTDSPESEPFIKDLFSRLKQNLTALPPDSALLRIRQTVFSAEAEVFFKSPFLIQDNLLEYLWEVQTMILDSRALIPKDRFAEYVAQKELLPNTIAESREEKRAILGLKIEELQLLDFLFEKIFAVREIEQVEMKVIEEILVLKEEKQDIQSFLWNPKAFPKGENPVNLFVNKVEIYATPQGQQNQTIRLLNEVDNTIRTLPFLQELRMELPRELRPVVTEKMAEIIEMERRAFLETS